MTRRNFNTNKKENLEIMNNFFYWAIKENIKDSASSKVKNLMRQNSVKSITLFLVQ